MLNDIRPPRSQPASTPPQPPRRRAPVAPASQTPAAPPIRPQQQANLGAPSPSDPSRGADAHTARPVPSPVLPRRRRRWPWVLLVLGVIVAAAVAGALIWYNLQLAPVDANDKSRMRVTIARGMSPLQIAEELRDKRLIRDTLAFEIYTRSTGVRNQLQAGLYSLSPSESLGEIVDHLRAGKTDSFQITFYPGATLRDNWTSPEKRTDVTTMLLRAGYPESEIQAALAKQYDHPLFRDKPSGTTLEGYVWGETYRIDASASVEDILRTTFDEYWKYIETNRLIEAYQVHKLNLYQAITLASLVQGEVTSPADQAQVAQVFYTRLATDTVLGSDVTFVYASRQAGMAPRINIDSPYNTRQVKGLPPGPVGTPGVGALEAVAHPAGGDYVYFVSGEDGKTYFSRTEAEHVRNTREYCGRLCQY